MLGPGDWIDPEFLKTIPLVWEDQPLRVELIIVVYPGASVVYGTGSPEHLEATGMDIMRSGQYQGSRVKSVHIEERRSKALRYDTKR